MLGTTSPMAVPHSIRPEYSATVAKPCIPQVILNI